jgi:hypothetical protein
MGEGESPSGDSEPVGQEVLKQKIIDGLQSVLHDWKDGIPDVVLSSVSPDVQYKVRKAWFQMVCYNLSDVLLCVWRKELHISEVLFDDIFAYYIAITQDSEFVARLTTQEDIDKAVVMVKRVVAELEK